MKNNSAAAGSSARSERTTQSTSFHPSQRIGRMKRLFKWAVSEELIDETVFRGLSAVDGLKQGRMTARETVQVKPVEDGVVDATLAHLSRHVSGMVRVQRFSGLRPGKVGPRCQEVLKELWLILEERT